MIRDLLAAGGRHAGVVHLLFESAAYAMAFALLRKDLRRGDRLDSDHRWTLIVVAIMGAAIGAKLLHHLADPVRLAAHWRELSLWVGGKTIVGALLGGWLAVEAAKKRLGILVATGDVYVLPLLIGTAIGRLGCFFAGIHDDTHGLPSRLAWAVDFGDGIRRHPVQLYEIAFLVALIPLLRRFDVVRDPGVRFRAFVLLYCAFRLVADLWKPLPPSFAGLSVIQLVCLGAILVCWRDWPRIARGLAASPVSVAPWPDTPPDDSRDVTDR